MSDAMNIVSIIITFLLVFNQTPYSVRPHRFVSSESFTIRADPWPEADTLFRKDPRWLGSDDAYSIDLGSGKVLWLFADTFIATGSTYTRSEAAMVRNSLAVQQGYDPSSASIKFYWGIRQGRPASFFRETPGVWYWPGHGIRLDSALLIFLMKVRRVNTGLGFEVFGWSAVAIDNSDEEPSRWKARWLNVPQNSFGVIVGSASILKIGEYVYAFGAREPGGQHDVYIVRWPVSKAAKGDLTEPYWWSGERYGWIAQRRLRQRPSVIFSGGQTEFTVHFEPKLNRFIQIQTEGFGAAYMAVRWADNLTGSWSELQKFYRPVEADRAAALVYAGKSHPELVGADLVLTYVVNNSDFSELVNDSSIYYPRFLKGRFVKRER